VCLSLLVTRASQLKPDSIPGRLELVSATRLDQRPCNPLPFRLESRPTACRFPGNTLLCNRPYD